jgi:polar amino acid transport system substrate-binding protein
MKGDAGEGQTEPSGQNGGGERRSDALLSQLGHFIDMRDPYLSGHAGQMAEYAAAVALKLGLRDDRVEQVRRVALVHDIGKMGIPEYLLRKPDKLTEHEYTQVKAHALLGASLLEMSSVLRGLARFVRHHHEWWDGSGYPDGLSGEAIPLESRIVAVCDAVEAMASDRPYQAGLTACEITAELRRCAGTQFDPRVVEMFIGLIEREGEQFIANSALAVAQRRLRLAAVLSARPSSR